MRKLFLSLPLVIATSVSAENSFLQAGIGLVNVSNPYLGSKSESLVFPFISYKNGNFAIEGAEISYQIADSGDFALRSHIKPGFDFLDASKSSDQQIQKLADRKISVLAGFTLSAQQTFGVISLSVNGDVSGTSKGMVIEGGISKPFPLTEKLTFVPSLSVVAMNSQYSDYYFGLEKDFGSLHQYSTGSSTRLNATSTFLYKHSAKLNFLASISMSRMSDAIASSPIVESPNSHAVIVGVQYAFN